MSLSQRGFFNEKRAARFERPTALFNNENQKMVPKDDDMVIFFPVFLKQLFHKGKNYPWPKPEYCPRCRGNRVWGHGFATAFFDGFDESLWIKLYRCPDCRCVIRMRPKGYFKRFQAPIDTIRKSIFLKSATNRWLPGISRTRQHHWFKALRRRVKAWFGDTWKHSLLEAFDQFMAKGMVPVNRSV